MLEDFARAIDQAAAEAEADVDARAPSRFALVASALMDVLGVVQHALDRRGDMTTG